MVLSSTDEVENETLPLQSNSIEKITDANIENEKIENSGPKQLADLEKALIGTHIYSFLNGKERSKLRLLSQFFHKNFDDLHFNPYRILYPSLNVIERQLNDKFIDNAFMMYVHENENFYQWPSVKNFVKGFKLQENYWGVYNLNLPKHLQTYDGTQNFKLDISVGIGSVEITNSDLSDEQVTDPQVGDWVAITKNLTLEKILDSTNIDYDITKDQLVKRLKYFFVKKVETDDKGLKRIVVGELKFPVTPEEREPKKGDYWISSDKFKEITKVKLVIFTNYEPVFF